MAFASFFFRKNDFAPVRITALGREVICTTSASLLGAGKSCEPRLRHCFALESDLYDVRNIALGRGVVLIGYRALFLSVRGHFYRYSQVLCLYNTFSTAKDEDCYRPDGIA